MKTHKISSDLEAKNVSHSCIHKRKKKKAKKKPCAREYYGLLKGMVGTVWHTIEHSPFNHKGVYLPSSCNLKCFYCSVWRSKKRPRYETSQKGVSAYESQYVYIYGGEPLLEPSIADILKELRQKNNTLALWTNGHAPLETWGRIAKYLSRVYLYLPINSENGYLNYTGNPERGHVDRVIEYLKTKRINITVNCFLKPENIEELPFLYELAYYKKVELLIHYNPKEWQDPDSIHYIKRFKSIPRVIVQKHFGASPRAGCPGVPFESFYTPLSQLKVMLYRWKHKVQLFFR